MQWFVVKHKFSEKLGYFNAEQGFIPLQDFCFLDKKKQNEIKKDVDLNYLNKKIYELEVLT